MHCGAILMLAVFMLFYNREVVKMFNKRLLAVFSVFVAVFSLVGVAEAVPRYDSSAVNRSIDTFAKQKPSRPTQLVLRPAFQGLKSACLGAASSIAKLYRINFDGSSAAACGCIASHAQVTGVPDSVAIEVAGHIKSGNIKKTTARKYAAYENVIEYCIDSD